MRPLWPEPGFASPADLAACREMLRAGSRTFFAASLLLPQRVRDPAGALYAFCRLADDAVDLDGGRLDVLARLRERLSLAYEGRPRNLPVDRALADVLARFSIPPALPEALFEGFEWDARGRRYEDLAELRAFERRNAARRLCTLGPLAVLLDEPAAFQRKHGHVRRRVTHRIDRRNLLGIHRLAVQKGGAQVVHHQVHTVVPVLVGVVVQHTRAAHAARLHPVRLPGVGVRAVRRLARRDALVPLRDRARHFAEIGRAHV